MLSAEWLLKCVKEAETDLWKLKEVKHMLKAKISKAVDKS